MKFFPVVNPEKCIELKEDIFYLEKGKHKYAGKRRIIGRVISETGYGFYNIEVLASDGPNALGKGLIIQRPAGNILSAQDCTHLINKIPGAATHFKAGGHVEGVKDGKKVIMDSGSKGGMAIGASHKEGGIQGEVGTDGHRIEFQGSEIILTAPVSSDDTLYDFEGKKMTPREIASKLNTDNGGVAFADGGEVHSCKCTGRTYEYGGKTMSDIDIVNEINRKAQLQKGIQTETNEHRTTLERLNDGYITIDQALAEIAETHLKENPNYYVTEKIMDTGGLTNTPKDGDFKIERGLTPIGKTPFVRISQYRSDEGAYYYVVDAYKDKQGRSMKARGFDWDNDDDVLKYFKLKNK